jgi:hypothetical protein
VRGAPKTRRIARLSPAGGAAIAGGGGAGTSEFATE